MQIASSLLNILFTAIVGSTALAFGLAFGLGGQDAARRYLNRAENSVSSNASQIQQSTGQMRGLPQTAPDSSFRSQTTYNQPLRDR